MHPRSLLIILILNYLFLIRSYFFILSSIGYSFFSPSMQDWLGQRGLLGCRLGDHRAENPQHPVSPELRWHHFFLLPNSTHL